MSAPLSPATRTQTSRGNSMVSSTEQTPQRPTRRSPLHIAAIVALSVVLTLIQACASLPEGVQRPASQAMVGEHTALARMAAAAVPAAGDQSGLRLIPDGDQALASRIELIRRAERSLDVQTYHLASDGTGALFLAELRNAAARG